VCDATRLSEFLNKQEQPTAPVEDFSLDDAFGDANLYQDHHTIDTFDEKCLELGMSPTKLPLSRCYSSVEQVLMLA
jgi:hypothetical protein